MPETCTHAILKTKLNKKADAIENIGFFKRNKFFYLDAKKVSTF